MEVIASRISYVGDLGWELYVPMERGREAVGRGVGGGPAARHRARGHRRLRHDRPAREGYRAFGFELDADYTVVEADMAWWKVKDQDFVGKEAHVAHRESEPVAKLCTLTIDDHTSKSGVKRYPLGREPVDDPATARRSPTRTAAARTSRSTGAAPSVGKHIVMAYLPPEHADEGEQLAVEYMTELYPATVAIVGSKPIFDPENARIRS